jgi:hypothetical protein
VPDDYGPVHAVLLECPDKWRRRKLDRFKQISHVEFIEYEWNAPQSVCGRSVRVVYPMPFDADEDDACPQCKQLLLVRSIDPEEYHRQLHDLERQERQRKSRRLAQKKSEEERQRIFEDLDEFYERQGRDPGDIADGLDLEDPSTWIFPNLHQDESEGDDRSA